MNQSVRYDSFRQDTTHNGSGRLRSDRPPRDYSDRKEPPRRSSKAQAFCSSAEAQELRTTLVCMPVDAKIRRSTARHPWDELQTRPTKVKRGRITRLSPASRRRLQITARNLQGLTTFVTCTYPSEFPGDGREVKRHFSLLRKWLVRRGAAGIWLLEFQERGAPHLHAFITKHVDELALQRAWSLIAYGMPSDSEIDPPQLLRTQCERIRSKTMPGAYAAKYGAKLQQKDVPEQFRNVGRFWACFGGLRVIKTILDSAEAQVLAPVVRALRNRYHHQRRTWRHARPWRDTGTTTWTAYGLGPLLLSIYSRWERHIAESIAGIPQPGFAAWKETCHAAA